MYYYVLKLDFNYVEILIVFGEYFEKYENDMLSVNYMYSKVLVLCFEYIKVLINR